MDEQLKALCTAALAARRELDAWLDEHGYPDKDKQWELRQVGNALVRAQVAAENTFVTQMRAYVAERRGER